MKTTFKHPINSKLLITSNSAKSPDFYSCLADNAILYLNSSLDSAWLEFNTPACFAFLSLTIATNIFILPNELLYFYREAAQNSLASLSKHLVKLRNFPTLHL